MKQHPLFASAHAAIAALIQHLDLAQAEGCSEVLARLSAQDTSAAAFRNPPAAEKPVTRHAPQVLSEMEKRFPALAAALAQLMPHMHWAQSQSYTDDVLGEGFSENYAWAELIGPHGFFSGEDFTLGFLLLGPHRHYLDHYHPAPELYLPLTAGSHWKKGDGPFVERAPGEVIWHLPMVIHATKTFATPLLAAYSWTRNTGTPARLVAARQ